MIKDKLKAILKMYGKSNKDGAQALGINYQSFLNKISSKSPKCFKTSELIKIAHLTGTKLAFIDKNNNPVIIFDLDDIE